MNYEYIFFRSKRSKHFDELPLTFRAMPNFKGKFEDMTLFDI